MREGNVAANIPTAEALLLVEPLYNRYELDADTRKRLLYQLGSGELVVDSFCVDCGLPSTFKRTGPYAPHAHSGFDVDLEVILACTRSESHIMKFYFRVKGNFITKVGQYPSVADLVEGNVKRYRKVLGARYTEFTKAIGLAAHGVGVGSFVYLRRIFEDLITKAFDEAMKDDHWQQNTSPGFREKRMNEKIQLLKDYLPFFLVENREVYGILSTGVHDLSEQECLEYFDVVKTGIELILDDEIERRERKAKTSEARKAIDAIKSRLAK